MKMHEVMSNNRRFLNGRVQPPIVLHSEKELFIAQNAHNLVWEKYRSEYDELEKRNDSEKNELWNALHVTAKQEIDKLIINEIDSFRKEKANNPLLELEERIEQLEEMIEEIRDLAEEANDNADEAMDKAEEALDKIEELKSDDE